jgi:2Fe-2S ferredoxin
MSVQITIQNLNDKSVPVLDTDKTVLQVFGEAQIDWMQACGGKGRCTSCRMQVLEGSEQLTAPSAFEQKMQAAGRLKKNERLACQCKTMGSLRVRVPRATQLPHLSYTD